MGRNRPASSDLQAPGNRSVVKLGTIVHFSSPSFHKWDKMGRTLRNQRNPPMARKLDLNALLLFFEVVNARSITSAAKKLEIPKSTISRKLMFLEDQLGAVLLRKAAASWR
jgi:hypothetical protein